MPFNILFAFILLSLCSDFVGFGQAAAINGVANTPAPAATGAGTEGSFQPLSGAGSTCFDWLISSQHARAPAGCL